MPNRAKGESLTRVVVFLLVASVLVFSGSPIAQASPTAISQAQSELQALRQLVDKLDTDLSKADEDYNQAAERLKQTQAAQTKTQSELAKTQKDLDAAQQQLMSRLVEIYKNGNEGMLDVLLGAASFTDLVNRFEQLGRVGAQDSALVKQVDGYVAQVKDRQAELAKQAEDGKARTAQLADAQQKVAAQLATKTQALKGKEVQLAQLQKEEQARQVALAAAAKKAAAKAAAEAAQQAAIEKAAREKAAKDRATKLAPTGGGPADKTTGSSNTRPSATPAATPATAPPGTQGGTPDTNSTASPSTDEGGGSGSTASETRAKVVDIALSYLGVPYTWAGSSPNGFDCSGFVTYVFAKVGVDLPHSSAMQYGSGTHVSKGELRPGDLVFFYSPIHHVGIYIGNGQMVDSRGSGVQIDDAFWDSYAGATRVLE